MTSKQNDELSTTAGSWTHRNAYGDDTQFLTEHLPLGNEEETDGDGKARKRRNIAGSIKVNIEIYIHFHSKKNP